MTGAGQLQGGEALRTAHGVTQLAYFRAGRSDRPLAVFLPGGGHLARVAYGHEGADRRSFIDAWLAEREATATRAEHAEN